MNKNIIDPVLSIPSFYYGRSIFITGVTGFLGTVLIEKLLRSCTGIQEIFLLIRPKKNASINERLQELLTNSVRCKKFKFKHIPLNGLNILLRAKNLLNTSQILISVFKMYIVFQR